jgi:biotin carboxyl carrier protein
VLVFEIVLAKSRALIYPLFSCSVTKNMLHRVIPILRGAAGAQIGAQARRCVSTTAPTLAKHTIKVPSMGDSITEGTIVEWIAQAGQMVKEGDVVALVETDKVTVDIKAEFDGVVMKQFGEV